MVTCFPLLPGSSHLSWHCAAQRLPGKEAVVCVRSYRFTSLLLHGKDRALAPIGRSDPPSSLEGKPAAKAFGRLQAKSPSLREGAHFNVSS
uniref:Uncharacterized protein n=1 Tax=Athene cunicularia TaxID=194338 RepID=A0A663N0I8_ATHCN